MAKLTILRLTKSYGNNNPGEVAGFSPDAARHILLHNGAEKLAEVDPLVERYDVPTGKVVPLKSAK